MGERLFNEVSQGKKAREDEDDEGVTMEEKAAAAAIVSYTEEERGVKSGLVNWSLVGIVSLPYLSMDKVVDIYFNFLKFQLGC